MIERFNFYDLYGYLIPGTATIVLIVTPFLLTQSLSVSDLPAGELSVLVLAVVFAYLLGYFVQSMATNAIPSSFGGQYPSVWLLNPSNETFSPDFKRQIAAKVEASFHLNVAIDSEADKDIAKVRQDAFFQARGKANPKEGSYSQQFQGLYSMMRGLVMAFLFGLSFMIGWTLDTLIPDAQILAEVILTGSVVLTILLAFARVTTDETDKRELAKIDGASLGMLALALVFAGYLVGHPIMNVDEARLFILVEALYSAAMLRFYASYRNFSILFAKTVWESLIGH